jgi:type IV pilus assembly protein PilB
MHLYSEPTSAKLLRVLAAAGRLPDNEISQIESQGGACAAYLEEKISAGAVNEDTLCNVLAKGYSMRRMSLAVKDVDPKCMAMLPQDVVRQHAAIVFKVEGRFAHIALVDPIATGQAQLFKSHTQLNSEFFLISPSDFKAVLQTLGSALVTAGPSFGATTAPSPSTASAQVQNFPTVKRAVVNANTVGGSTAAAPAAKRAPVGDKSPARAKRQLRVKWQVYDPELVVDFCEQILRHAIADRASDIHIEGFRDNARVRMRIDGTLQIKDIYSEYLFKNYAAVISRFKILAECDIAEKRVAQDGAITLTDEYGQDIDFRFSLIPTKNGERIVMRILAGDPALSLDKIGFDPDDYKKVIDAITAPQGMVLVTGPTGSGKTTTLYGALQHINSPDINILTAEDPIEYYLEGAGQVQANEKIGLSFSAILRSFLRQDPEVILVGEIRDQETIDIAVKAALTGHLLLSTLHTNDAVSTITRMLNMGVPNFMISSALALIVAQRLARKNCASCRTVDARVTPDMLTHIGFTEEEALHVKPMRGTGCPTCNGSGLKGRRGIYEVLRKTKHIEEAILNNAPAPQILAAARLDGFKTMQEIGRELIKAGEISVEEFQHTLVMD